MTCRKQLSKAGQVQPGQRKTSQVLIRACILRVHWVPLLSLLKIWDNCCIEPCLARLTPNFNEVDGVICEAIGQNATHDLVFNISHVSVWQSQKHKKKLICPWPFLNYCQVAHYSLFILSHSSISSLFIQHICRQHYVLLKAHLPSQFSHPCRDHVQYFLQSIVISTLLL